MSARYFNSRNNCPYDEQIKILIIDIGSDDILYPPIIPIWRLIAKYPQTRETSSVANGSPAAYDITHSPSNVQKRLILNNVHDETEYCRIMNDNNVTL